MTTANSTKDFLSTRKKYIIIKINHLFQVPGNPITYTLHILAFILHEARLYMEEKNCIDHAQKGERKAK